MFTCAGGDGGDNGSDTSKYATVKLNNQTKIISRTTGQYMLGFSYNGSGGEASSSGLNPRNSGNNGIVMIEW